MSSGIDDSPTPEETDFRYARINERVGEKELSYNPKVDPLAKAIANMDYMVNVQAPDMAADWALIKTVLNVYKASIDQIIDIANKIDTVYMEGSCPQ